MPALLSLGTVPARKKLHIVPLAPAAVFAVVAPATLMLSQKFSIFKCAARLRRDEAAPAFDARLKRLAAIVRARALADRKKRFVAVLARAPPLSAVAIASPEIAVDVLAV